MSLFAHRSYKPDEQLDPIDREIIKRGLARLKLQADGSFLLVDNADAASGTLVVQVVRQRIAREFENAARAEAEAKERAAMCWRWTMPCWSLSPAQNIWASVWM